MTSRARAERWAVTSAGHGRRGRWAARRLFRAAVRGDAAARDGVVQVARTPGHRLRERATHAVAELWAETRDPRLRQAVLDLSALAVRPLPRLLTRALLDLLEDGDLHEVGLLPVLLTDPDTDVRDRTATACRNATGRVLSGLWHGDSGPGTSLRDVLLENSRPPATPRKLSGLWSEWIETPSPALGDALLRWGRPAPTVPLSVVAVETGRDVLLEPAHRAALLDALLLGDHPLRDIAAAKFDALDDRRLVDEMCDRALTEAGPARYCAERGLVPKDPVRRAMFYLLTGRPEQLRALDPDGGLLSLAYAAAPDAVRARAREVMLADGGLDLVRVIVGDDRRARIAAMPDAEARYLAEQLAARREWDDLWALVQDLPIAAGIELIRLFGRWAPRHEDQRRLFRMLHDADPETVKAGSEQLRDERRAAVPQATFLFHDRVNDVSFAPDGPFLAVAGINKVAGVFDLRTARLTERYGGFGSSVGRVLHLGGGTLIAGEQPNHGQPQCRLVRCADGAMQALHTTPGAVTSLVLTGHGGSFAAGTRAGELLLGTPGGPVRVRPVSEFGLGKRQWPRQVAAHRDSGRLAVIGASIHLIDPAAGTAIRVCPGSSTVQAAFVDADTLVRAERDGALRLASPPGARHDRSPLVYVPGFAGLGTLPHIGQLVVACGQGDLYFLNGSSLERAGVHSALRPGKPTGLTVSPGGEFLAVGHRDGAIDLFDLRLREVPGLIRRPVADLVPRHLGLVAAATADPAITGDARSLLELLRASLEHRFRYDVEIGDAVRLAAGEYDISL
ncbi:hypothetical protein [Spirillospora sp. NPDC048819]|uniref:hypothetical protein n=1 Tax=Spirillospora sp. NPDC048819 TaxID=3155268 RepID=UPI0033C712AE